MTANLVAEFENLTDAVHRGDFEMVSAMLREFSGLAAARSPFARYFESPTNHWFYVRDSALHLAAAGYRTEIAAVLLAHGSDPNSSDNHRRGTPLHYASDGFVGDPNWNAARQVEMITMLLGAGAKPRAADKNGATALHRAVRTRCSEAVKTLLDAGCDPLARNKSGSTPFHLAVQNTGRGGSGDERARDEQRRIIEEFLRRGVNPHIRCGNGKTVRESAAAVWVKKLLDV